MLMSLLAVGLQHSSWLRSRIITVETSKIEFSTTYKSKASHKHIQMTKTVSPLVLAAPPTPGKRGHAVLGRRLNGELCPSAKPAMGKILTIICLSSTWALRAGTGPFRDLQAYFEGRVRHDRKEATNARVGIVGTPRGNGGPLGGRSERRSEMERREDRKRESGQHLVDAVTETDAPRSTAPEQHSASCDTGTL